MAVSSPLNMRKTLTLRLVVLLVGLSMTASGADVSLFGILKSQQYQQTNDSPPSLISSNAFAFNALVYATSNKLVTSATLRRTGATNAYSLQLDLEDPILRYEFRTNSQSAIDSVFPSGGLLNRINYTFTMDTAHDGVRTASVNFNAAALLGNPPVLAISNFGEAQTIDTTADFTLRWKDNAGLSLDFVQLVVSNESGGIVFTSPLPLAAGGLTGNSTSAVIPANALPPASTLSAHLAIIRPTGIETNDYPGAVGLAGILRDTAFPLRTIPAPPSPILRLAFLNQVECQLDFPTETNRIYHLQASTNLASWHDLLITNPSSAKVTFIEERLPEIPQRYYRVRIGP